MDNKLELRQAFFRKHTEAGLDGLPKITTAPHDLFEWMWQQFNTANVVNRREMLIAFMESLTTEHITEIEIADFDKVADRFLGN